MATTKREVIEKLRLDVYEATAILAELEATGRLRVPPDATVAGFRVEVCDQLAEVVDEHWVDLPDSEG